MYGTVARMKAKPGTGELLAELGRQLSDDRPAGMVGTWVYQLDADPEWHDGEIVYSDVPLGS